MVPWMRGRIPLVFLGGQLAAVGDLWVCEEVSAAPGQDGVELRWDRELLLD